jgi:hypothetical protein
MLTNFTSITSITSDIFVCETCDFKCFKKGDYKRHLMTRKHNNVDKMLTYNEESIQKKHHTCLCGKEYRHRQSLSIHKKKCSKLIIEPEIDENSSEPYIPNETMNLLSLFKEQINENKELRNLLMEQNKQLQETNNKLFLVAKENGNITNNNYNNNYNKTFNLQVYLNETCKDAINLTDFVDTIKIQIKDLETVGEKGYAEGISKIFINNLQQLNKHSRPIHCSDSKRETLYIKDENQWTKDDEEKTTLTKAIKQVANKNIKQISEWEKLHSEYSDPESKINDKYMKIVLNSMSGTTKEESNKNYEKIIKNVIKETVIDKL